MAAAESEPKTAAEAGTEAIEKLITGKAATESAPGQDKRTGLVLKVGYLKLKLFKSNLLIFSFYYIPNFCFHATGKSHT